MVLMRAHLLALARMQEDLLGAIAVAVAVALKLLAGMLASAAIAAMVLQYLRQLEAILQEVLARALVRSETSLVVTEDTPEGRLLMARKATVVEEVAVFLAAAAVERTLQL